MRLTCHDCGSTIYISAEAPNCPECGAELESYLRGLEYVRECYRQASAETLAGDHDRALAILAQGLSAVNASELHLLAALIHRKQGEFDGMRRHVAAIPVDDPLRPEGEWLLRSHQQRQRAVRQASKEETPPAVQVGKAVRQLSPEFYTRPPALESPLAPQRNTRRPLLRATSVIAFLLVAALLLRQPLTQGWARLVEGESLPVGQAAPTPAPVSNSGQAAALPTSPPAQPPTPTSEPTAAPTPLPTATLPVPVAAAPEPVAPTAESPSPTPDLPAIAAVNDALAAAVATAAASRYDLAAYFAQAERGDLAVLPVSARLLDGRLVLTGEVPLTAHRLDILELAGEIPGVQEVDAIDLVVRLPATYTVGDGDTLWLIAYYLYGDGSRWEEVYAANAEVLGNSVLLNVGMELQVPER